MDDISAVVMKSGETPIRVELGKNLDGLRVTVQLLPKVEEFIRGMGTGELQDVRVMGRHWQPIGKDHLQVYHLTQNPGVMIADKGNVSFRIDKPGSPLLEPSLNTLGQAMNAMNMTFLRLAGASVGNGVTFCVKGVYTDEQVTEIGDKIEAAAKKFYVTYMKPYKLSISVCTQEIP